MSSNKKINNNLLVISEYMDKLELDNCRLRNSDEILNNVIEEKDKEIERLNKALLDIKELVVNNACLSEEDNRCVDDLIYYKCDELLDIVNKALGSDKE